MRRQETEVSSQLAPIHPGESLREEFMAPLRAHCMNHRTMSPES